MIGAGQEHLMVLDNDLFCKTGIQRTKKRAGTEGLAKCVVRFGQLTLSEALAQVWHASG
ncbi:hypothetical protein SAMN05414139_03921 [Burkholderia sp. D7]|nr:hypothetical protein SAMN05414139_03921 [Burkholderia sp. D7]